jgi:hypothetical protein
MRRIVSRRPSARCRSARTSLPPRPGSALACRVMLGDSPPGGPNRTSDSASPQAWQWRMLARSPSATGAASVAPRFPPRSTSSAALISAAESRPFHVRLDRADRGGSRTRRTHATEVGGGVHGAATQERYLQERSARRRRKPVIVTPFVPSPPLMPKGRRCRAASPRQPCKSSSIRPASRTTPWSPSATLSRRAAFRISKVVAASRLMDH